MSIETGPDGNIEGVRVSLAVVEMHIHRAADCDAVTVEMAMLPSLMCTKEPAAAVQTASSCAAVEVDALNVPVGGRGIQG